MPESDSDFDLLGSLIERAQEGTAEQLDRRMRESGEIKNEEEVASQRRLGEMWEREYERQRTIAEAQAQQRRQEQLLLRLVLIAVAIVLLVVIVLVFILSRSGADTLPESLIIPLAAYV